MELQQAQKLMEEEGHPVDEITRLNPKGRRELFDIASGGRSLVLRLPHPTLEIDPQYNSPVSLERDAAVYDLVREKAGLPTPKVVHHNAQNGQEFLVVSKLPGKDWKTFMEESNFSRAAFLKSLKYLGADVAQAHQVTFPSYGSLLAENQIEPAGVTSFADCLEGIMGRKLGAEQKKMSLTQDEFSRVESYLKKGIAELADSSGSEPVLTTFNLHPLNFLVDGVGKPCGYPDVAFPQAGVPMLDFYYVGLQLFNYFDVETFAQAQDAFFEGYAQAGGVHQRDEPTNQKLEALLCLGQTLTAVTAYHGASGLRETWSGKFKDLLFQTMDSGQMDYVKYADIIGEKTRQQRQLTEP